MFILYCALTGLVASGLIVLISNRIRSKLLACALCCLLGMAVAVVLTMIFINTGFPEPTLDFLHLGV